MDSSILLTYGLGVFAAAAVLLAVLPYLSGDIKAEKRKAALQEARPKRMGERTVDAAARRKQVAESLKDLEKRGKFKKVTLEAKLMQAGFEAKPRAYYIVCAALGTVCGLALFLLENSLPIAAAAAGVGAFGIPAWTLGFFRKRRIARFVNEFPNAVDIIIRGVKAGLPLGDCLRVIATESPEPLRTEFRRVVEAQTVGLSVSEAVDRMPERVPVTEAKFFSIVIGIQQKAGGNLAETLANLSRVIRERKKMQAKVKAVSSEAKTSAGIIGSLPFFVGFFVYLTTPKYMELLWTTTSGQIVCGCCALWMFIGVMVMKKMINFDI